MFSSISAIFVFSYSNNRTRSFTTLETILAHSAIAQPDTLNNHCTEASLAASTHHLTQPVHRIRRRLTLVRCNKAFREG